MPTLTVGATAIAYEVRRSRRATRGRIVVAPRGVAVVVPPGTPDARVREIVEDRRLWIAERWTALQRTLAAHPGTAARFETGATIPYRGRPVPLRLVARPDHGGGARVTYADGFVVELPARIGDDEGARDGIVEGALRLWLRRRARADALELTARHGPPHGLVPRSVRIKDQRTLWGSCTARGDVNLNWRLVLAPPEAFEYVVVHELCHLRERHHGPAFWRLVGDVLPDFAPRRRWLRDHGPLLTLRPGDWR
ncbi:MAG TPA: SprT family zinc-dependent metalloprotease [Geminicoccaceae bacterium]|nr:SprT family zinc-dependent metalloprotease [Geminicoccaceae bacterium]